MKVSIYSRGGLNVWSATVSNTNEVRFFLERIGDKPCNLQVAGGTAIVSTDYDRDFDPKKKADLEDLATSLKTYFKRNRLTIIIAVRPDTVKSGILEEIEKDIAPPVKKRKIVKAGNGTKETEPPKSKTRRVIKTRKVRKTRRVIKKGKS